MIGRELPCPKCQERFVVAAPANALSDDPDEWNFSGMHGADEDLGDIHTMPRRSSSPSHRRQGNRNAVADQGGIRPAYWITGATVAVLTVVAGLFLWKPASSPIGPAPAADTAAIERPEAVGAQPNEKADPPAENQGNRPVQNLNEHVGSYRESMRSQQVRMEERIVSAQDKHQKATLDAVNASNNPPKVVAAPVADGTPAPTEKARAADATTPPPAGEGPRIGRIIPEFSAAAIDNTTYQLKDRNEKVLVVAFMGVQCPLANLYYPNLVELSKKFGGQSVAFVAVNSNGQDTIAAVREQAKAHQVAFPVLKDAGNKVADAFGAQRTPEFFVLDEQRAVRYHGQIDDQYGYQARRQAPSKHYVADAIQNLLAGRPVALAATPLQGCHIGRKGTAGEQAKSSFYRDVLPILQNRCQQCHRVGDIGPFALDDFEACSNWGETIKEAVTERRMPPWPADPEHGKFLHEQRLPDEELATLVKWVDEGCPEGNIADKPPAKAFVDGWNIGQPDEEYAMAKPFTVPATGVVDYQHFVVSPVFTKDVWVQAVECKYGNRSVVHHMLALLHFPKDKKRSQDGLRNGFFAAGAPGANYLVFPPGQAKRIPKGAQLVLQMHYTPNGTATKDQSRLGVILAKEPIEYEVQTYAVGTEDILLKAGDANYTKSYTEPISGNIAVSALMPHLHLRGKSFDITATFPDGKKQKLISVPKWDFNWQYQYQLAEPVRLPKGSKLTVTAAWDNSVNNPNNILPPVDVRFGEQTFDEMFIGYVNYVVPLKGAGSPAKGTPRTRG